MTIPRTVLAITVALALACAPGCAAPPVPSVGGTPVALSITLLDGRRGQFPARGPLLLAFLDPTAPAGFASRSQIPVLRSMATQYGHAGLSILIVDATGRAGADDLVNFSHDWNLRPPSIAIAAPTETATLARAYGVATAPDTLLVTADGVIRHRWRGTVAAAQDLALTLQALLPPPPPHARRHPHVRPTSQVADGLRCPHHARHRHCADRRGRVQPRGRRHGLLRRLLRSRQWLRHGGQPLEHPVQRHLPHVQCG
ncbi:hypothetical protein OHA25_48095 [Nonomuraea sp. NBC_00507]|uniref:peroxiredoxin family protein n=1 Tax=Nonomuraea sp. NBC_00507 TaxID=2976002 RepID=UPI002E19575A